MWRNKTFTKKKGSRPRQSCLNQDLLNTTSASGPNVNTRPKPNSGPKPKSGHDRDQNFDLDKIISKKCYLTI